MKYNKPDINADFVCKHCGTFVSAAELLAGVGNRNHCPYCLWSRHLDLFAAGDRLSACKGQMRPVGLTLKRSRNKYATSGGELMLVHHCTECGHISINRIAADDVPETLLEVYMSELDEGAGLLAQIEASGIALLGAQQAGIVYLQLFGLTDLPAVLAPAGV